MSTLLTSTSSEYDRPRIKEELEKLFDEGNFWKKLKDKKVYSP